MVYLWLIGLGFVLLILFGLVLMYKMLILGGFVIAILTLKSITLEVLLNLLLLTFFYLPTDLLNFGTGSDAHSH